MFSTHTWSVALLIQRERGSYEDQSGIGSERVSSDIEEVYIPSAVMCNSGTKIFVEGCFALFSQG